MSVNTHLDWDDGVDLLDETPPNRLVAEGHRSVPISPLKVISLLPHGKYSPENHLTSVVSTFGTYPMLSAKIYGTIVT